MASIFYSLVNENYWTSSFPSDFEFGSLLLSSCLKTQKASTLKQSSYQLFGFYLVRLNSNNTPKKYTKLNWKTMEPFIETKQHKTVYGFRLGVKDFYVDTAQELETWMHHLSKVCILNDIEEDFVMIKVLGTGSTSTVYLAESLDSRKEYAVKCINKKNVFSHRAGLDNLINEIQILQTIKHPNIVELFHVYEGTQNVYLVMEYLPRGDLHKTLAQKKKFSEDFCIKFAKSLLETLSYLHSKNIVHRDLKLENIIMTSYPNCQFKIIDFGLAYFNYSSQTAKCGSPGYLAPEMLSEKTYSEKIDVFSAGVVLYIIISGKHPFQASSTDKILKKNIECKYKTIKNVSKCALNAIQCMMEQNPADRPSALEMLNNPWLCINKEEICSLPTGNNNLATISIVNNV
jgi:serine/threonine protein kinase